MNLAAAIADIGRILGAHMAGPATDYFHLINGQFHLQDLGEIILNSALANERHGLMVWAN